MGIPLRIFRRRDLPLIDYKLYIGISDSFFFEVWNRHPRRGIPWA